MTRRSRQRSRAGRRRRTRRSRRKQQTYLLTENPSGMITLAVANLGRDVAVAQSMLASSSRRPCCQPIHSPRAAPLQVVAHLPPSHSSAPPSGYALQQSQMLMRRHSFSRARRTQATRGFTSNEQQAKNRTTSSRSGHSTCLPSRMGCRPTRKGSLSASAPTQRCSKQRVAMPYSGKAQALPVPLKRRVESGQRGDVQRRSKHHHSLRRSLLQP
mmetsp:Transcript_51648/g.118654  ORF Transcript_51648/g.118654 Transcript_51648/m.118654 type:complete len:214 (-) Transcript_51648:504-1145(-)